MKEKEIREEKGQKNREESANNWLNNCVSRRKVLKGFSLLAYSVVLGSFAGCGSSREDGENEKDERGEGKGTNPAAVLKAQQGQSDMCNPDKAICIDLSDPNNAKILDPVGGAGIIKTKNDEIIVIHYKDNQYLALSALCTHKGCGVEFSAQKDNLTCPCHGAEFDIHGKVLKGPAKTPLKEYKTKLDGKTLLILLN